MKKIIFLTEIAFDDSPKVRAHPSDGEVVEQYAQAYLAKKELPPIDLFWDKDAKKMYLADGRHRCAAMVAIKRKAITAMIHAGTYEAALAFALLANSHHGVQRSQADKRQCVVAAIKEWPKHSNLQIATLADVSDGTVAAVRKFLEESKEVKPEPVRTTKSGKKFPARLTHKSELAEAEPASEVVEAPVIYAEKDDLGFEIPKGVQQYWERIPEVLELLSGIGRVISHIKQAQKDQDPMFGEMNCSGAIGDLERAYHNVKLAMPHTVCTSCSGHPETQKKGCRLCFGKGLISKFRWDNIVPDEIKKIRTLE